MKLFSRFRKLLLPGAVIVGSLAAPVTSYADAGCDLQLFIVL